jgi:hypothetical protein
MRSHEGGFIGSTQRSDDDIERWRSSSLHGDDDWERDGEPLHSGCHGHDDHGSMTTRGIGWVL